MDLLPDAYQLLLRERRARKRLVGSVRYCPPEFQEADAQHVNDWRHHTLLDLQPGLLPVRMRL